MTKAHVLFHQSLLRFILWDQSLGGCMDESLEYEKNMWYGLGFLKLSSIVTKQYGVVVCMKGW